MLGPIYKRFDPANPGTLGITTPAPGYFTSVTFSVDGTAAPASICRQSGYLVLNGGSTGFALNNAANDASNLLMTDAGLATFRATTTVTAINLVADSTAPAVGLYQAGGYVIIRGSSVAIALNNAANNAANLLVLDNGDVIPRGALKNGGPLWLSNTATTGLSAGALALLTTSSIVIYDATGTAYRVPCITP